MHDLVLRGGTIVDGTGREPYTGDVAIEQGRLVDVGGKAGPSRRELDASGLLITPGFVDVHTHYDAQALWDPMVGSSCWHGVTTVVMGNCGVGFAPVRPAQRDWLIGLMEGVEDIPADVLRAGLPFTWETFPEYLDVVAAMPRAINIAAQLPHAPVRVYAMGERGLDAMEEPDDDELDAIARITQEALEAGAVGVSTLRTLLHRSSDGRLMPTHRASDNELLALASGMRAAARGVVELASDYSAGSLDEEFKRFRMMAQRSRRPISVPLSQNHESPDGWRAILARIDHAVDDGLAFSGQTAVRPVGVAMGLESRAHLFSACRAYAGIASLPLAERVALMRRPEIRDGILREAATMPNRVDLACTFSLQVPIDYEPDLDNSIAARAKVLGVDALALAYDTLLDDEGQTMLYTPVRNFAGGDAGAVYEMLRSPHTVPGLGDGGAHCTQICDMSFPTSLLTHWGRDRRRGELLPIEWLVRRQTYDTASLYGFPDRGLIAPGYKADVNAIDFDSLRVLAPKMAYDFPAGGKRLTQRAEGYQYTIVDGELTLVNGMHTAALPGRLVRSSAR